MIAWLIVFVVLFLLAVLQLGIKLKYSSDRFELKLRVGFFRFGLPEGKDKEEQPKEKKSKSKKKDPVKAAKTKAWLRTLWIHLEEILSLLGRIMCAPVLDILKLHIVVGANDPETCALNYGKIQSGIGAALPVVENLIGIRRRSVIVDCDFLQDKTVIDARAEITVRVYQVVAIAVFGIKLLIKLFQTQNNEFKAVLANESSSS